MAIETGTYISDLNPALPNGDANTVSELDDTDRLIKSCLQNTFPNANGAINPTVAEFNKLVGLTATTTTLNYTTTPNTASHFLLLDGTGRAPVANLPTASTSAAGIAEKATQAEVDAATDTDRFVTPETLGAYSGLVTGGDSHDHSGGDGGDIVEGSFPALAAGTAMEYAKYDGSVASGVTTWKYASAEVGDGLTILRSGTYRISVHHGLSGASGTATITLYKNVPASWTWTSIGTDSVAGSNANQTSTFDVALNAGDRIGLEATATTGNAYLDAVVVSTDERLFGT